MAKKVKREFWDDPDWAERYEQQAKAEGMSLAAWLRRAARMAVVSVSSMSHLGHCTNANEKQSA